MKIDLFDVDEFVELNHLKEITSPVLFERGGVPNPNGLVSNDIFGVSIKSRKETFAYIDLSGHFLHPHIYKIMKRIFRNIDKLVNGEMYFSIDKQGQLVKDPNGETGIDFLYDNWNKIKWQGNGGMSTERANLLSKSKKNEVWMTKQIVIPAFYRDINSAKGGGGETSELNNLYTRLIRMAGLLKDRDMFDFTFHSTNYTMQETMVEIYNFFKDKLDKKTGLLRKYLMGKNVDYGVRTVITAPTFHGDDPSANIVDFLHGAIPISQACVLMYPFIIAWLRNFFEREMIEAQYAKWNIDVNTGDEKKLLELKNPEAYFNDQYIERAVDRYIKDPSSRFDKIEVPTNSSTPVYLIFIGKYPNREDSAGLARRYLTWTDLLFLACSECGKDKHIMVTRYPILDNFGIFVSKFRIYSTLKTAPMEVNGTLYKWYPVIDFTMNKHEVSNAFNDSTSFSNSYLPGLDGDYDGDQVTVKILWTQEANAECDRLLNSKAFYLSPTGGLMRKMDLEAIQTFYCMTKDPS